MSNLARAGRAALLLSAMMMIFMSGTRASVIISADATSNINCSSGICTPTAKQAYLNVTDLTNMLAASDVTVNTGSGAMDIHIRAPFSWVSAHVLTLHSDRHVRFEAPVTVAGSGGVAIVTGAYLDSLSFVDGGQAIFWDLGSSLTVNGASYTLIGDLATLASDVASNPRGNFALARDYDASVDGTYSHPPVPTKYSGMFEGLGHAISNLTIVDSSAESFGLFESIATSVSDLNLKNVSATGAGGGSLAGYMFFGASILHCYAQGTVKGGDLSTVGGLAGLGQAALIAYSHADVIVRAGNGSDAGGLAGDLSGGGIVWSSATGAVSVGDFDEIPGAAGGLLGSSAETQIEFSFAEDSVTGGYKSRIGGLVGTTQTSRAALDQILDSYAHGSVTGGDSSYAGGLLGYVQSANRQPFVTDSYSTGKVQGGVEAVIGGLIGFDGRTHAQHHPLPIQSAYWDMTLSGITDPSQGLGNVPNEPGITGLTHRELRSILPDGFSTVYWRKKRSIDDGLPYLIGNPPQ